MFLVIFLYICNINYIKKSHMKISITYNNNNTNNLNNKYFKLLIRLLKEHKLYQMIKSNRDFHDIPLNTIEDIINIERLIGFFCFNGFISIHQYKNFFKDFYKELNIKTTIIDAANQIINSSSKILVKTKKQPIHVKISIASKITEEINKCNLLHLLINDYRFHPFYDVARKHNLTADYLDSIVSSFIRKLKYTKINYYDTDIRTNELG